MLRGAPIIGKKSGKWERAGERERNRMSPETRYGRLAVTPNRSTPDHILLQVPHAHFYSEASLLCSIVLSPKSMYLGHGALFCIAPKSHTLIRAEMFPKTLTQCSWRSYNKHLKTSCGWELEQGEYCRTWVLPEGFP